MPIAAVRTAHITTLLLLGIACGDPKVDPEELEAIPVEQLDELQTMRQRIEALATEVLAARKARKKAYDQHDEAAKRAKDLEKRLEAAEEEQTAVRLEGEADLAVAAERSVEALRVQLVETREFTKEMSGRAALANLRFQMLDAELEWRQARLEVERARGAEEGGAEIEVGKFVAEANRARESYDNAVLAYQKVTQRPSSPSAADDAEDVEDVEDDAGAGEAGVSATLENR